MAPEKKKMGRPPTGTARDKQINIRLTERELDEISECAKRLNITRTDAIMKAIRSLLVKLNGKSS